MNHKVLLADDSLTIQKVIKITLANEPYEITEVSSEEELFEQLPIINPKIVFLDFNLSETSTGYDLTKKIKSLSPDSKVLLLLGTFDSVDESAMLKNGASDKIIKPFDSNKFIAICKNLIDTFDEEEEILFPEKITSENELIEVEDNDDQWEVEHSIEQNIINPDVKADQAAEAKETLETKNPLLDEINDWGMSVPDVISDSFLAPISSDIPPVISRSEINSLSVDQQKKSSKTKYPNNEDLDYPTLNDIKKADEDKTKEEMTENKAESISEGIPIDSFNFPQDEISLPSDSQMISSDDDVKIIEEQIRDEVEENLWQADEHEDLKKEVSSKIEEVNNHFKPSRDAFDDSLFKPIDDPYSVEQESDIVTSFDERSSITSEQMTLIKAEIEVMVKKYVKDYLDDMFKQKTEKVAWEVIPDLAENLIRQELTKIGKKVLDDQS